MRITIISAMFRRYSRKSFVDYAKATSVGGRDRLLRRIVVLAYLSCFVRMRDKGGVGVKGAGHWSSMVLCLLTVTALIYPILAGAGSARAFPEAEGFGAYARGGRGGVVIHVRNLNDSGQGSLREAVDALGPRIVVFDIGGTIVLRSKIKIDNPFITIAGQTAPGDGIALRTETAYAGPAIQIATNDVVIRYLRVRPGPSRRSSVNVDAVVVTGGYSIILDHCSLSWGTDEVFSTFKSPRNITVQWSILSEALHDSTHEEGPHSRGALLGGAADNISLHHNLMAHNLRRNPRVSSVPVADVVNNVVYNWGDRAIATDAEGLDRPARINVVGNYAVAGSDTLPDSLWMIKHGDGRVWLYARGNIGPTRESESLPETEAVRPKDRKFLVPFPHPAPPVTTTSAREAYARVLAFAGAVLPVRDPVDQRVVNDVVNHTGRIINDPMEVGGWPEMALIRREAGFDTDGDGMPDSWEQNQGFNPADSGDGVQDADLDGFTNVEEYLNQMARLAPQVDAGEDQTAKLETVVVLNGKALDDGFPNPPGSVAYRWSMVDGPGKARFRDNSAPDTTVAFSQSGIYLLRLTAIDGEASSSDELTVTVADCCPRRPPARSRGRSLTR